MNNAAQAVAPEPPRTLFRVELAAVYTVSARSPAEALGLAIYAESTPDPASTIPGEHDVNIDAIENFAVTELSETDVTTFWHDGEGKECSTWQAHLNAEAPEVIACSEWP